MISKHTFKKTHNNFYEKQKFTNFWIFSTVVLLEALLLYLSVLHVVAHKPFIFSTFTQWPLVLFTLLCPTMILLAMQFTRLETIFNDDGIFYRWMPYSGRYKMIQWEAIKKMELIEVNSSGFDLWFSKSYDKVNFVGGKYAVVMVMKNGKKRILGTQKAENLNRVLMRLAGTKYEPTTIEDLIDYRD